MNQWWEEEEVSVSDAAIGGYDRIGMCDKCKRIIGLKYGRCGRCQRDQYHNPYMFYFSDVYTRPERGRNER